MSVAKRVRDRAWPCLVRHAFERDGVEFVDLSAVSLGRIAHRRIASCWVWCKPGSDR